jgi:transcriptional regulator with XRE-family HTH domain
MSSPFYELIQIDIIKRMTMSPLAIWFEKKFLEWQMEHGRSSLDEFAKVLQISRGYLSQILNGDRETIGMKSAILIANRLNDHSILDILGYSKQDFSSQSIPLESLSEDLRSRLKSALLEIRETVNEKSLDPESPEAKLISEEVLKKHGFIVNSND